MFLALALALERGLIGGYTASFKFQDFPLGYGIQGWVGMEHRGKEGVLTRICWPSVGRCQKSGSSKEWIKHRIEGDLSVVVTDEVEVVVDSLVTATLGHVPDTQVFINDPLTLYSSCLIMVSSNEG